MICFSKQKTAYEMRISDWSSDVCPSNLDAEVLLLQLGHEGLPQRRAALGQQLGADRQLLADRQVAGAPGADVGEDRQQLDGLFGQAVDGLLLVAGIVRLRHHALVRSEEHTSELQSLMRISSAVFCLKKKN